MLQNILDKKSDLRVLPEEYVHLPKKIKTRTLISAS